MYTFSNCGLSINFLHLVKLKNNQVYGYNCTTMSKLITVLLAESALETFPKELLSGLEVRQFFSKLKKTPSEVMFDMGYHSNFTKGLTDIEKRGRPDIVHFALLSCFGSILAREQRLKVLIHTYKDKVIEINPEARLPKNIDRFNGLILQLFKGKKIPLDSSNPLMVLTEQSLIELLSELRPKHDLIIEFSVKGEQLSSSDYSKIIFNATNPLLIFGAFPHGEISDLPNDLIDKRIGIYEEGLDLFAVISQILASQHMIEEEFLARLPDSDKQSVTWK